MSERGAERSVEIAASPQACFDALIDYESMPEWQRSVKHCEVVAWDDEGRGREVDWKIDAKLRSISYRLAYSYDEPHRIECRYVEGDMEDLSADYTLRSEGAQTTLVTLSLRVRPGVRVPGPLERILNGRLMNGALDDLKKRVEQG
jgi:uncharacterized protein YndB with AHSA1/START domain